MSVLLCFCQQDVFVFSVGVYEEDLWQLTFPRERLHPIVILTVAVKHYPAWVNKYYY